MRSRLVLLVALGTLMAIALPGARPTFAAPPMTLQVDMIPTAGGQDATAPGVTNKAVCNANLKDPADSSWDALAHDPVNSNSLVCATLLDVHGDPEYGVNITLSTSGPGTITDEDGPNPSLQTDQSVVGKDGFGWFYVYSTSSGTQTLTATAGGETRTVTEVWDPPHPQQARVIGCTPDSATVQAGSQQQISCTVTDGFGNGVGGAGVTWSATDTGGAQSGFPTKDQTTDATGVAKATIVSAASGSSTYTVTLDSTTTDCNAASDAPSAYDKGKPPGICSDSGSITWTAASTSALSISPESVTNPQFTRAVLTATAKDQSGGPRPGVKVSFSVTGANHGADVVTTGPDGQATFSYLGRLGGTDTITAFVDDNDNGKADPNEPTAQAAAKWTPGCRGFQKDPRNQVVGTDGADKLMGSTGYDIMCGLGGDDSMIGKGGDDVILGGGGNDHIVGGDGSDSLDGGPGNDVIDAGVGADEVGGGRGADRISGGDNVDSLHGGTGPDHLFGGLGNDDLFGGPGHDVLDGGPEDDFCRDKTDHQTNCER
ncbi:MAG: Ig-like domain-containing protein [Actinomycetota bacterium]